MTKPCSSNCLASSWALTVTPTSTVAPYCKVPTFTVATCISKHSGWHPRLATLLLNVASGQPSWSPSTDWVIIVWMSGNSISGRTSSQAHSFRGCDRRASTLSTAGQGHWKPSLSKLAIPSTHSFQGLPSCALTCKALVKENFLCTIVIKILASLWMVFPEFLQLGILCIPCAPNPTACASKEQKICIFPVIGLLNKKSAIAIKAMDSASCEVAFLLVSRTPPAYPTRQNCGCWNVPTSTRITNAQAAFPCLQEPSV